MPLYGARFTARDKTDTQRWSCEDKSRNCYAAIIQGMSRIIGICQRWRAKEGSFPTISKGNSLADWHFDSGLLASSTVRGSIFVVFNNPICDSLLQQPWKTFTVGLTEYINKVKMVFWFPGLLKRSSLSSIVDSSSIPSQSQLQVFSKE